MRFKRLLVYSIAAAAVGLVSPRALPILDTPSVAYAETSVSLSIGTFYDELAPHGSWVNYQDSYVFIPGTVSADWRPYTVGHWANTKRYGWMWVSDEPFGWATYHYGRWGYAEDIGWYWVPGKRWAPAWVSWRRSKDHVIWAPLPPGRGDDVDIVVEVNDIPDNYWVAVPSRSFLDVDLSAVVVIDDNERFIEAAEPVGSVTVENNIVVNNVIDVDYVEKATEKKVETIEIKETDDPKQVGKGSDGEVAVFSGEVKEEKDAKPAEVKDVEEIKKQKAETGGTPQDQQPGQDTTQGQSTTPDQGTPTQEQDTTQGQEQPTNKKKAKGSQEPTQQEAQPEQGQEQPVKKKQKAKGTEEPAQQQEAQPEQGEEQPVKKKQKAKAPEEPAQQQEAQPQEGQQETVQKKKQRAKASGQPPEPEQSQEQPVQKKEAPEEPMQGDQPSEPELKKPQGGCDPATGESC